MANVSRRNFFKALTFGVLGLSLTKNVKPSLKDTGATQSGASPIKIQKYNTLGKTGIKVPDVSCGAISFFEPNVLRYAYELGVTYFDTAEGYMRTKSETFIGQALKEVRDKRMQTDYVDIAMIHQANDLALLENEEIQAAYSQMKKEGKIRFTGFSTHNPTLTMKQALDNDFSQVILFIYNHMEGKEMESKVI